MSLRTVGPRGRYAPVRGVQNELLRVVRGSDWTDGIPALAVTLSRPERNVWLAVVGLANRGLLIATVTADGVVRIRATEAGRRIRL